MTMPISLTEKPAIAFLGLGVMGFPMAGHLNNQGYSVCVYNRSPDKAADWVATYAANAANTATPASAATPMAAVEQADIIFCCVGNDNDLREVMLGQQGVIHGIKPGAIVVDHTTASADVAKQLYQAFSDLQCGFIDAPVSGGQQGAEKGVLTVMCGGDKPEFDRVAAVMSSYAKTVKLMGPVGSGQMTKMVNQVCIAGLLQGLAEGLQFADKLGLDAQQVIEVISQGAAQSWQMDNRHKTMLAGDYDHGFAVDWMRKDLDIALKAAANNGLDLPVTELVNGYYQDIQAMGGGRWDTSSLLARLKQLENSLELYNSLEPNNSPERENSPEPNNSPELNNSPERE